MRNSQSGVALVAVLTIVAVCGVLAFGTVFTTQIEQAITRNDVTSTQAAYVAQAGLQHGKTLLFQNFGYALATKPPSPLDSRAACGNIIALGIDWNRDGTLDMGTNEATRESYPIVRDHAVDLKGAQGRYRFSISRDPAKARFLTVSSVGWSANARATVNATFDVSNAGAFDYAIFSGKGSAQKWLNGGATIHGGVYIVGDKLNPEESVIASNGDFAMLNSYDLTNSLDFGDAAAHVRSSDRTADNLCAALRVQYGKAAFGGSTQIGMKDNKMLGVFVGDNYKEDLSSYDAPCGSGGTQICSDYVNNFDLGANAPEFPTFDGTDCNPAGTKDDAPTDPNFKSWGTCISEDATSQGLEFRRTGSGTYSLNYPSGSTLPGCNLESLVTTGSTGVPTITMGSNTVDCRFTDASGKQGGFYYDGSNATAAAEFQVYGTVNFMGLDVVFSRDVQYNAWTYGASGRSASFVAQNHLTSGGRIQMLGKVRPDPAVGFPDQVLAIMAEGNMRQVGTQVIASVYSGGLFRTSNGNATIGNIVSNEFCTTKAGGTTCEAGQKAQVAYVDMGANRPDILDYPADAQVASFLVLSYERK